MRKVIVIGEALIDFIPTVNTSIKNAEGFIKSPGGAPANVASCIAKLGGKSKIITQLGEDGFGDFLEARIKNAGVDTTSILRTNKANTALAFVSLDENGEREFLFYRKPSADMLLESEEIEEDWFIEGDILHFCSVNLVDYPVKQAHKKAIEIAKSKNMIISFDPNVRLPLWENPKDCKNAINEFIPYADIIKVSDEELEFITGIKEEEAIASLLKTAKIVIYTVGSEGAYIYTKTQKVFHKGYKCKAIDTTGAGDSFIGAVLYQIINKKELEFTNEEFQNILNFANATASIVVGRKGVIDILPRIEEVEKVIKI